jgi:bifunctional UDP-N-acetylglucosamine pyrophosphorylase/glucosamine-1-phosphate N-acetyltransferase
MDSNCKAIVLAAGKGVRMQSEMPKVLHRLSGKPLVLHVIDNLIHAGLKEEDIIVVVGYRGDDVIQAIGNRAQFVWQKEQLGTGHAVMQAEQALQGYTGIVIVACGDVPLIKPETFSMLVATANDPKTGAVVLTMELENPFGYGRIIRDEYGNLLKIVEEKDAAPEQKAIREVNTGTYAFKSSLLFQGLKTVTTKNAQREYYLPDALTYIRSTGTTVKIIKLDDPTQGSGINSKEELAKLEDIISKFN